MYIIDEHTKLLFLWRSSVSERTVYKAGGAELCSVAQVVVLAAARK